MLFFDTERTGCSHCHLTDLFVGVEARNNGLYKEYSDQGKATVTEEWMDEGSFKIPSLRNIALTAPYMHDGSLATLDDVIEHYAHGVKDHENLHLLLRDEGPMGRGSGTPRQLKLSVNESAALRAFLETLTDSALISDERWADPF